MLSKHTLFLCLLFLTCNNLQSAGKYDERISTTISCRDCDYIPKVPNAGSVTEHNGTAVQVMHNGLYVLHGSYHGEWMSIIIKELQGHHEPQEEKAFYEVLQTIPANAIMLELGSAWSYYSMWFNKAIPGAQNYMIEPHPNKYVIGQKNFALNNMHGTFFNAFIGRTSTEKDTFVDWDRKHYSIPRICIDDFVAEHNIPFIHILHSDIQGAEHDMLLGCEKTIASGKVGYMFISTHAGKQPACAKLLKESGFIIIAEHTVEESYSADGLIVARHKDFPGLDSIEFSKKE